jgi:hypothetical protein
MRSLSQNCVMTASYARKKKAHGKLTARTVMLLSRVDSEPFSSGGFAGLQDVDGFGEVAGAPGAAAQFAQDAPGLEPMPLSLS